MLKIAGLVALYWLTGLGTLVVVESLAREPQPWLVRMLVVLLWPLVLLVMGASVVVGFAVSTALGLAALLFERGSR